jgi:hypothetical protein
VLRRRHRSSHLRTHPGEGTRGQRGGSKSPTDDHLPSWVHTELRGCALLLHHRDRGLNELSLHPLLHYVPQAPRGEGGPGGDSCDVVDA